MTGVGRASGTLRAVRRFRLLAPVVLVVTVALCVMAPVVVFVSAALVLSVRGVFQLWLMSKVDHLPGGLLSLADADLPAYTVLVPLYQEADGVPRLIRHLGRIDYPPDRLEVLLLCEEDDSATASAVASAIAGDPRFRLIVVPDAWPRTKPRACNVGLAEATGDLCVIFDAEDRPEPDQLRRAASRFAALGPETVCLQAVLDFHNFAHNRLSRWFAVEYGSWFRLLLRGVVTRGLAAPLGGTSNHFRVAALRALGGWDAHNVTEDAELGVRLHMRGYRTALVDSVTWEEACARLVPWVRQRTRWMKGFLQTWLTHVRSARGGAAVTLHLVVGATVGAHLATPVALVGAGVGGVGWVPFVAWVGMSVSTGVACARFGRMWAVTFPVYQLLMVAATYRAVWYLVVSPHQWEKTPHGLSGADTDPGG